jgi:excisionase family DNA binding protein
MKQSSRSIGPGMFSQVILARILLDGRATMNLRHVEDALPAAIAASEFPLSVKEAAKYLGVSPQTVYLWVERKQIPHLRVMGRNIRFLKSDLEPFRASFKEEMENE